MYYITGDIHGNYQQLRNKVKSNNLGKDDILIVLGDFCANYFETLRDRGFKGKAHHLGTTIFAIHGNHEARPETLSTYKEKEWNGGTVYYEEDFPNLLFAKDGEVYNIDGKEVLVCGGAYSIDKYHRAWNALTTLVTFSDIDMDKANLVLQLAKGENVSAKEKKIADDYIKKIPSGLSHWWHNEQPNKQTKEKVEKELEKRGWKIDVILTHTSPQQFEPTEMFLENINQGNIDKTTEIWLGEIESKTEYQKWYAGHYHTNKRVNEKFQFLFEDVMPFCKEKQIMHSIEEENLNI